MQGEQGRGAGGTEQRCRGSRAEVQGEQSSFPGLPQCLPQLSPASSMALSRGSLPGFRFGESFTGQSQSLEEASGALQQLSSCSITALELS